MVIKRENKRFGLFNSLFRYAPQRIEQSKKKHHKSGDLLLRKIVDLQLRKIGDFTFAIYIKSCRAMNAVINAEGTCLLSAWQASFRWHELYLGSITELGNLHNDVKGNAQ